MDPKRNPQILFPLLNLEAQKKIIQKAAPRHLKKLKGKTNKKR